MNFILIFVIFSAPLLVISIIALLKDEKWDKKWFSGALFIINIFFPSIGPLVISIMLLNLSTLSKVMAAATMAGFVPSAACLLLWFILMRRSFGSITGVNLIVMTLLNIGLPLTMVFLRHNDITYSFIEIFSYEFLAMAIGVSVGSVLSPLMRFLDKKHILLGILFLSAVLIGPGIYYEYQWLVQWIAAQSSDFTITSISTLVIRYFGISSLSFFIFKRIKEIT